MDTWENAHSKECEYSYQKNYFHLVFQVIGYQLIEEDTLYVYIAVQ